MGQDVTQTAFFAEIHGRVQGVGFRYSTKDEARRLHLCGWVRNTLYGTVEVFAQGPKDKIEKFFQWLHEGPSGARVDQVDYSIKNLIQIVTSFISKDERCFFWLIPAPS